MTLRDNILSNPEGYRMGMSALEARNEGLDVPSDVPDCATLKPHPEQIVVTPDPTDQTRIVVTVPMGWSWVNFHLELTDEEAQRAEQYLKHNSH